MELKFKIEQIAVAPSNAPLAKMLLMMLFKTQKPWTKDTVTAQGTVNGEKDFNMAELNFCYEIMPGVEFEVLDYMDGPNFVDNATDGERNIVSHFGMHCTEEELEAWRCEFARLEIQPIQEVWTTDHTSEYLRQVNRKYHYCIFGTRHLIGTDLKFIVRIQPGAQE